MTESEHLQEVMQILSGLVGASSASYPLVSYRHDVVELLLAMLQHTIAGTDGVPLSDDWAPRGLKPLATLRGGLALAQEAGRSTKPLSKGRHAPVAPTATSPVESHAVGIPYAAAAQAYGLDGSARAMGAVGSRGHAHATPDSTTVSGYRPHHTTIKTFFEVFQS